MTEHRAARVRAALLDPAAVFASPEEVERDAALSHEEKLAILEHWEEDAQELDVPEDQRKSGDKPSRLEEVVAARARLTGGTEAAPDARKKGVARADPARMRVRRFVRPVREIIHADQELDEAALKLSLQEHPVLPVADADQIVGVLARAELARAPKEENPEARVTARVMMTTDLAFCYLDDDVTTARAMMDKHGCNHLLVVDRAGVLVGTLEGDDLPPAGPRATESVQERPEVVEPREEHAQGVATSIQPGGLDVYTERLTIKAPPS
jgi:CBS domain-containing protein